MTRTDTSVATMRHWTPHVMHARNLDNTNSFLTGMSGTRNGTIQLVRAFTCSGSFVVPSLRSPIDSRARTYTYTIGPHIPHFSPPARVGRSVSWSGDAARLSLTPYAFRLRRLSTE